MFFAKFALAMVFLSATTAHAAMLCGINIPSHPKNRITVSQVRGDTVNRVIRDLRLQFPDAQFNICDKLGFKVVVAQTSAGAFAVLIPLETGSQK